MIHDTTELDYTSITSLTGLGQIGTGGGRGYLCHNTLAVEVRTRTVLGLANQILARRDHVPQGRIPTGQARPARLARAGSGGRGSEAVGPAPDGATSVNVCNRAADIFEYIEFRYKNNGNYIVRSQHDRRCMLPHDGTVCPGRLHPYGRGLEPLGGRHVQVQAQKKQPARLAKVLIAAAAVELLAPKQPRGSTARTRCR